jgi:hypothetical protein
MVNSPKIRHSKPHRDPVTIDLDAEKITTAEQPAADAAASAQQAPKAADPMTSKPVTATSEKPLLDDGPKVTPTAAGDKPPFGPTGSSPSSAEKPAADARLDKATPPPAASLQSKPQPERRGGVSAIAAGIIGGVIALAGGGALQYAGLLPAPGGSEATSGEIAGLRSDLATLREQVDATPPAENFKPRIDELAAALEQVKTQVAAAASGTAASPEAAQALEDRLKAIESAIASAQSAGPGTPVDLGPLQEQMGGLDSALAEIKAAGDAATAAANEKIAALQAEVSQLTGKVAEQAEQPNAALAIAASALKATIDRGDPFMTEIETYASIAPQSPEIAALRGMAASGVPSRTAIADAFPAAANAMIAAAKAEDPNAGLLDRLVSSAQSLVQVRPVGMVEGEGAPAIVARMEVALHKGDYAATAAEFDNLPDAAKAAGAEFIAKVKARQAADGLVETILSTALKA